MLLEIFCTTKRALFNLQTHFSFNGGPKNLIDPLTAQKELTNKMFIKLIRARKTDAHRSVGLFFSHTRLKTITIAVQLSLQRRSFTASFTRRRLIVLTGKPSYKIKALSLLMISHIPLTLFICALFMCTRF